MAPSQELAFAPDVPLVEDDEADAKVIEGARWLLLRNRSNIAKRADRIRFDVSRSRRRLAG